jgi:hypothetical protein
MKRQRLNLNLFKKLSHELAVVLPHNSILVSKWFLLLFNESANNECTWEILVPWLEDWGNNSQTGDTTFDTKGKLPSGVFTHKKGAQ